MRSTSLAAALLVVAALFAFAPAPATAQDAAPPPRTVMTWIPPYDRDAAWARLNETYLGYGPANSITQLGLQFWKPTSAGGLVRVSAFGAIGNAEIAKYVNWAHAHGIKVMLTVYNGEPVWDWPLAKSAFGDNRLAFVQALVKEMTALNLDGVDVDLEGPGVTPTADDKAKYVAFMKHLSGSLRLRGKLVQIDTFSYIYNAPNQTWWSSLFPYVDTLASMGYEEIGRNAPTWQSFAAQRAMAGSPVNMNKLILGVPSYYSSWLGDDAPTQMSWFADARVKTGVGVWDARVVAPLWRAKPVWQQLYKIRAQNP